MAEVWDVQQLAAGGFERAYAELDWYDGPRAGLADLDGVPHYFQTRKAPSASESIRSTEPSTPGTTS